jgi:NTP pyrophosphatase (non-canonical NTP hydrolase)
MDDLTLEDLRQQLAIVLAGLEHPPLGAAVALAEECGELSRLILDHHAYGAAMDKDALAGEIADVLVCLCEMATRYGIDLGAAARSKIADLEVRAPRWRQELGTALARARGETGS